MRPVTDFLSEGDNTPLIIHGRSSVVTQGRATNTPLPHTREGDAVVGHKVIAQEFLAGSTGTEKEVGCYGSLCTPPGMEIKALQGPGGGVTR